MSVWTFSCHSLMKAVGVTEELKVRDPMQWVELANNCKAQA